MKEKIAVSLMEGATLDDQNRRIKTATFTNLRDYLRVQGHLKEYVKGWM